VDISFLSHSSTAGELRGMRLLKLLQYSSAAVADRANKTVFRRRLSAGVSDKEVVAIIQRLACRTLSPDEIIGASLRRPHRTTLLEARVHHAPPGTRSIIWINANSNITAARYKAHEVEKYPDIMWNDFDD